MPKYTVKNKESGKTVTFNWTGKEPPTDADMAEVFAASESFKPPEAEPVSFPSGGFIDTMSPELPEKPPYTMEQTEQFVRPVLEYGGMMTGGTAGAVAGPVGGIAGAGLGYAGGKQAADLLYQKPQGTVKEELLESVVDVSQGAAMEMGGAAFAKLVSYVGKPVAGQIERVVKNGIRKAIRPSKSLTRTAGQTKQYYDKATDAVTQIILNKNNLRMTDESGKIVTGLPKTLDQFSEAVNQTKKVIFSQYDELAKTATGAGGRIRLEPITDELLKITKSAPFNDTVPQAARYAMEKAETYLARGSYSAEEAQEAIQLLNQSLKAFYKNPSYETATKAYIDSVVANNLRKSLDDLIVGLTGKEYQQLKNSYGALKHIEQEVAGRATVHGRRNIKGLIDFSDIFSGSEVIYGILSMNPAMIGRGVGAKAIASWYRYINNPNRIVKNMFSKAEDILMKQAAKIEPSGFFVNPATSKAIGIGLGYAAKTQWENAQ
jgi:hypothetical protein